jgi:outer membrane protein, protease secretion system
MKTTRLFHRNVSAVLAVLSAAVAFPAQAMNLIEAYTRAQAFDPAYQVAKADRAVSDADITVAKLAYLPTASANFGRESTENQSRTTFQVVQPILDLEKFATMRSAAPREVIAEANFRSKEQDLAARVLRIVASLVKARETSELNEEQIRALTEQATRSQRRFELGQGTVTEVSTAQVRLDQARATRRALLAQQTILEKQFAALVGVAPPQRYFEFVREPQSIPVESLLSLLDKTTVGNAQIIQARANERLAELNQQQVMAGYLPQINAVARTTKREGSTSENYTGFQLSIPLGVSAASFASQYKARVAIDRSKEVTRDVEEKQRLEVERLWALVVAGEEELRIRRDAIRSAELSAEGNVKSYEAGVVTAVDVINAILTVFETKREYLEVLSRTVEDYLSLQMVAAEPPVEALRRVQSVLLDQRG